MQHRKNDFLCLNLSSGIYFVIFWCWIQNAGTQNETPMQIYPLLFTRPVKGIDQLMAIKGGKTKASRFHKKISIRDRFTPVIVDHVHL